MFLIVILAAIIAASSCQPERHCRPGYFVGYGDKPSDYK
jgi:hypothetical protein